VSLQWGVPWHLWHPLDPPLSTWRKWLKKPSIHEISWELYESVWHHWAYIEMTSLTSMRRGVPIDRQANEAIHESGGAHRPSQRDIVVFVVLRWLTAVRHRRRMHADGPLDWSQLARVVDDWHVGHWPMTGGLWLRPGSRQRQVIACSPGVRCSDVLATAAVEYTKRGVSTHWERLLLGLRSSAECRIPFSPPTMVGRHRLA